MSADLVQHALDNLPRHVPDAFERAASSIAASASTTPGMQFLIRNSAVIDRIRADRLAEQGDSA